MSVINNRSFGRFWSVWCTITHRFGVLERFTRFAIPGVRLCVGYQHSPFCPILVRLVDYYSLFWGPRAISTIHDPGGAFTCPSSTLIVLANSDPFRGLLLTFLGSRSDFHSCSTQRCTYVSFINTRSFGRFWPVLWTITRSFGSRGDFHD